MQNIHKWLFGSMILYFIICSIFSFIFDPRKNVHIITCWIWFIVLTIPLITIKFFKNSKFDKWLNK